MQQVRLVLTHERMSTRLPTAPVVSCETDPFALTLALGTLLTRRSRCALCAANTPEEEQKATEADVKKRLMRLESHLKLEAAETEPMDTRLMRLETFIKTTYKPIDEKASETSASIAE